MAEPGQILRRRALGSAALYRVLQSGGPTVLLEAIDVPGLKAGHRMRVTAAAADAMESVLESDRGADPYLGSAAIRRPREA
jgi:hypothetical protein